MSQNQEYKDYQYAPIRMKFERTGEVFNIGVILMDENGGSPTLRLIDNFESIANCLRIENPASHNFMLNYFDTQLKKGNLELGKSFSNSMYIEEPEWLYSDKPLTDAADELFDELVTIKRSKKIQAHISEKTPTRIITHLKDYAHEQKYKRIDFRRELSGGFNKEIAAIVYSDDDMKQPAIGVDVSSTAIQDFLKNTAYSTMALRAAKRTGAIKEAIMYMPITNVYKYVTPSEYGEAKAGVRGEGITVIDTSDEKEVFELIQNKAEEFQTSIYA